MWWISSAVFFWNWMPSIFPIRIWWIRWHSFLWLLGSLCFNVYHSIFWLGNVAALLVYIHIINSVTYISLFHNIFCPFGSVITLSFIHHLFFVFSLICWYLNAIIILVTFGWLFKLIRPWSMCSWELALVIFNLLCPWWLLRWLGWLTTRYIWMLVVEIF